MDAALLLWAPSVGRYRSATNFAADVRFVVGSALRAVRTRLSTERERRRADKLGRLLLNEFLEGKLLPRVQF